MHLDGARLWNAAVALGVPPGALTVGADTVAVCLSKGLGAPVGSVVAGSTEFVEHARRLRKMLGGGVRQGGVLAAAGLVALEEIDRLAEDHDLATRLAAGLRERGWRVREPQTNIVLVDVADVRGTIATFAEAGVRAGAIAGKLRLMTHRDVGDKHIKAALDRIGEVGPASTGSPAVPGCCPAPSSAAEAAAPLHRRSGREPVGRHRRRGASETRRRRHSVAQSQLTVVRGQVGPHDRVHTGRRPDAGAGVGLGFRRRRARAYAPLRAGGPDPRPVPVSCADPRSPGLARPVAPRTAGPS